MFENVTSSPPPQVLRQWAHFRELLVQLAHKYASFSETASSASSAVSLSDERGMEVLRLRQVCLVLFYFYFYFYFLFCFCFCFCFVLFCFVLFCLFVAEFTFLNPLIRRCWASAVAQRSSCLLQRSRRIAVGRLVKVLPPYLWWRFSCFKQAQNWLSLKAQPRLWNRSCCVFKETKCCQETLPRLSGRKKQLHSI